MAKKTFGEIYVKLNGAITKISKLSIPEFEAFLEMTDKIKTEFNSKKAMYLEMTKKKE